MRLVLALLLLLFGAGPFARGEDLPVVALQPLGKVSDTLIATAKEGAEARFRIRVEVLPTVPLPEMAFYPPRERYRAEKLLAWLEARGDAKFLKIVGLTGSDISTTKGDVADWGVFGLGSLGGKTCVISTKRLGPKDGQPKTILAERLVKVINHEIGHTFALEHCPTDRCLMQDALGTVRTVDREDGNFCPACAAKLGKNLNGKR